MPTRTVPRRSTAPARGTGRFGRPMPAQRPTPRRRPGRKQQPGGMSGMLGAAMQALPIGGSRAKKRRGTKSSKTGPAVGLVMAGAGALLGRRQMRKRRASDTIEHPTPVS
jgi:hypothetical protein